MSVDVGKLPHVAAKKLQLGQGLVNTCVGEESGFGFSAEYGNFEVIFMLNRALGIIVT